MAWIALSASMPSKPIRSTSRMKLFDLSKTRLVRFDWEERIVERLIANRKGTKSQLSAANSY